MTRLETVFNKENYMFDPVMVLREYLRERNDFMASRLTADQAIIMQAAASEFDNTEVEETADDETNVLAEAFGFDPMQEFDKIMAKTFQKEETEAHE